METRICTGMGLPVPLPPQELQRIMPEPSQVLHPTSWSDHRVHMQGTRREPLHVGQALPPLMGFSCSASISDLMTQAPAKALNPSTTWVTAPGDILQSLISSQNCGIPHLLARQLITRIQTPRIEATHRLHTPRIPNSRWNRNLRFASGNKFKECWQSMHVKKMSRASSAK